MTPSSDQTEETSSDRNFVVVKPDIDAAGIYKGTNPSQVVRKVARDVIDPDGANSEEDAQETNKTEIRIRERGTDTIHVYVAWVWERPREDDEPEWLGEFVTEAGLNRRGQINR